MSTNQNNAAGTSAAARTSNEVPPIAKHRLQKELAEIIKQPPPNCSVNLKNDDISHWSATLQGPPGTVYEGGTFELDILFGPKYPFKPPKIRFVTKIYHCNINSEGYICVDILGPKWTPAFSLSTILVSITALLSNCNPMDPIVSDIALNYIEHREAHDEVARAWVKKYAMPSDES
ncbi:ubiquitin-conjugating enzyme E2-24 kDa-like [Teleopsis dalmanni]|uniref:ubiquitin-conjugating enzyme E2-24 kDa-like n=1 Tax=Teleopsis dalmanni TaxID=139649 RepID=UPI0018CE612A|nr:ubiquitin-conjugating enzyme E2-24 kDa-like [Teleopsis dalmanni]